MPIEHLPPRYRPRARLFRDWLLSDKGVLLLCFLFTAGRTLSYPLREPTWAALSFDASGWVGPACWAAAAVLTGFSLPSRAGSRLEVAAISVTVAVTSVWGALYMFASPGQFLARGTVYLTVVAFIVYTVWRGDSTRVRVRGERV